MGETGKKARWRNIFTIPNLMSLFRLCLISSDLGGAYMGAVGISFLPYLAGSLLGMLPNMITFPIMGMNIRNIHSPEFLIAVGFQIGFTLLSIAFYALHRKRKCTDA